MTTHIQEQHAVTTLRVANDGQKRAREDWPDTFRGVGIVAVVLVHILPRLMHECAVGSPLWTVLFAVQRAAFFAVPGFVLLSALLNTASLLRTAEIGGYARSRMRSVVWPYIVWSCIYLLYTRWGANDDFRWSRIPRALLAGTAYPHLYFMIVLIQLLIVLPLLRPLWRRKPSFRTVAVVAILLTSAVYAVNHFYFRFNRMGSLLMWYIPVVALGAWMGTQAGASREILRRGTRVAIVTTLFGFAWYFSLARAQALNQDVDTLAFQAAEWIYVSAASFTAMALAERWSARAAARGLRLLGTFSLQIYLMHPLVLAVLDRMHGFTFVGGLASALVILVGLSLAVPLLVAVALQRLRLSALVFGR